MKFQANVLDVIINIGVIILENHPIVEKGVIIMFEYVLELLKGLRADINDPYKSHKAGDMIILLKKINRKIDNYDRAVRKRRISNRRI